MDEPTSAGDPSKMARAVTERLVSGFGTPPALPSGESVPDRVVFLLHEDAEMPSLVSAYLALENWHWSPPRKGEEASTEAQHLIGLIHQIWAKIYGRPPPGVIVGSLRRSSAPIWLRRLRNFRHTAR